MEDKFIAFLKKHNIYDRFIANYDDCGNTRNFTQYIKRNMPGHYLSSAFRWDVTPEEIRRIGFWRHYHKEWLKIVNRKRVTVTLEEV